MKSIKNLMRHEIYDFEIQILCGFLRLAFRTWDFVRHFEWKSFSALSTLAQLNVSTKSSQSPLFRNFLHGDKFICALDGRMNAFKHQMINCIFSNVRYNKKALNASNEETSRRSKRRKLNLWVKCSQLWVLSTTSLCAEKIPITYPKPLKVPCPFMQL